MEPGEGANALPAFLETAMHCHLDNGHTVCPLDPPCIGECGYRLSRGEIEKMAARDPLLVEREKTHGTFDANASRFKALCNAIPVHNDFNPAQHLAMTMIMVKIARASCNPREKDHWLDIAGYAKLGAEVCE